jgi:hypothetical protein
MVPYILSFLHTITLIYIRPSYRKPPERRQNVISEVRMTYSSHLKISQTNL